MRYALPATLRLFARHCLGRGVGPDGLPDPDAAFESPDGLAGFCFDLRPQALMRGYAKGLYLQSRLGQGMWWAPQQRMVLFIENFRMGARLAKQFENCRYRISFDSAFGEVVEACARPGPRQDDRDLLCDDLRQAFAAAHGAGFAHSVEIWDEYGVLVAGAYGLGVGKVFFTEAQFARTSIADKSAMAALNCHLQGNGYLANDAKRLSGALFQQGFSLVSRDAFNRFVAKAARLPMPLGGWDAEPDLALARWQPGRAALAGAA